VEAFLAAHHVMTLATCRARKPWAAAVFYAADRLALYFVSAPVSRHCADIDASGEAAAAVHAECRDWRDIKGLQIEGEAKRLSGAAARRAARLYAQKFVELASAPEAIRKALEKGAWYRLSPTRIRLIDNAVAFGHREELVLKRRARQGR
jgi:uncharacterized protein